jgi:ABC-2 type transport system permease protein
MNWNQLGAIIWLRWRLTRNQLSRSGTANIVFATIIFIIGIAASIAGWFIGLLVGIFAMKTTSPMTMLIVWDVIIGIFLVLWLTGIASEIQRSETVDIGRLLHLPVSLRQVFILNYIASHLSFVIILFLPASLGLALGLMIGRNWQMIAIVPAILSFVFMVTAWTYCLRGWLVRLMVNKRRRRAIIAIVTIICIILAQLPNILSNLSFNMVHHESWKIADLFRHDSGFVYYVLMAHKCIPLLWLSNSVMSLAADNVWPAILSIIGSSLIGVLGLMKAYRATISFYQGQAGAVAAPARPPKERVRRISSNLIDKTIPGIPEEASTLAIAFFRSLTRAPEVKMGLFSNLVMMVIFGGILLTRYHSSIGSSEASFIVAGAVAVTFFGMLQFFFNQFGCDRNGFRTLVLLPVRRDYILMGKNLALLPFAAIFLLMILIILKLIFDVPFILLLAALAQFGVAFVLLSMAGNFVSIIAPYRVAVGSLKPTKTSATTSVAIFLTHLCFPLLMLPIVLPAVLGLLFSSRFLNLAISLILLAALIFFYRLTLRNLGQLLQQREKEILQAVIHEIE